MMARLFVAWLRVTVADGLLQALWQTGVWRLMVFLLIYSTGLAIIFPITPTLMTNGFASLAAGHRIDCTLYPPSASPRECLDAHATVVTWMSWTNFISSSLLTFLCAPYVGHLSDRVGRKPFMLAGVALTLAPLAVIQLHLHDVLPIYWYYPASAAGGVVSSFTMTLTSVADLMEQRHRATAVGYLTSCFSVGMLAGPLLGGYLSMTAALWTCIAMTGVTWMYVALFVPECAPGPLARRAAAKAAAAATGTAANPKAANVAGGVKGTEGGGREELGGGEEGCRATAAEALVAAEDVSLVAAQRHFMSGGAAPSADVETDAGVVYGTACCARGTVAADDEEAAAPLLTQHGHGRGRRSSTGGGAAAASGGRLAGFSSGWSVIRHSSFYRRIAAIWVVVAMTWEGAGELLMQYLQYKLGFNTLDQAHVLTVLASGGLVVKLGLLALMVRWMGERRLLAFGLAAYALECLALAAAPTKAAGLAAVSIGSLASVCWPALTALQTAGVDPSQQGAVFGALQAISSMASGLGPLVFAAVFRQVTRVDSALPPMPGVVWYLAAATTAVAIGLALSLPEHPQPDRRPPQAPQGQAPAEQGQEGQEGQEGQQQRPHNQEPQERQPRKAGLQQAEQAQAQDGWLRNGRGEAEGGAVRGSGGDVEAGAAATGSPRAGRGADGGAQHPRAPEGPGRRTAADGGLGEPLLS